MKKRFCIITISSILIFVNSCGFQLRGTQPDYLSNISNLYIIDSDALTVGHMVRTQLSLSGLTFAPTHEEAEYTLRIFQQNIDQSVLSVSANTGKIEEYQLSLSVKISLIDQKRVQRIQNQIIRVTRDYAFDDLAVLGSESERLLLVDEMTKHAASQIIQRLNMLTRE